MKIIEEYKRCAFKGGKSMLQDSLVPYVIEQIKR